MNLNCSPRKIKHLLSTYSNWNVVLKPISVTRISPQYTPDKIHSTNKIQSVKIQRGFKMSAYSSAYSSSDGDGIPLTGVSLRWFINFIETDEKVKKILEEKGDTAIMDDLLSVIRDMTSEVDESFAEMLLRTQPDKNLTKPTADVFISYARLYLVNDMIPAIETLLPKNQSDDIYIWLDSLAINQRVKSEFNPDYFVKTLKQGIETISNVAVVLTPWDNPGNITRAWCIWELYSAVQSEGVNIQVLVPPTQKQPFRDALVNDPEDLMTRIGRVDINKAQAWSSRDRDMILDAARKADGGAYQVRESVIGPLRNWMASEALSMEEELQGKSYSYGDYDAAYHSKVLISVGLLLESQGKYEEAKRMLNKALDIRKSIYGQSHASVAEILSLLGKLAAFTDNVNEIKDYLEQALNMRTECLGEYHADVAKSMSDLASFHYHQAMFAEAEKLYKRVIEIRKQVLGDTHSDVARGLEFLANLYLAKRDLEEAESLFREALDIRTKYHSDNEFEIAISMNNVGLVLVEKKDYAGANYYYTKALELFKNVHGNFHSSVAVTLTNLADLREKEHKNEEAKEFQNESLEVRKNLFGESHETYISSLNDAAGSLFGRGKYKDSEIKMKEALRLLVSISGRNHPKYLELVDNLLQVLEAQDKNDEAKKLYLENKDLFKKRNKQQNDDSSDSD